MEYKWLDDVVCSNSDRVSSTGRSPIPELEPEFITELLEHQGEGDSSDEISHNGGTPSSMPYYSRITENRINGEILPPLVSCSASDNYPSLLSSLNGNSKESLVTDMYKAFHDTWVTSLENLKKQFNDEFGSHMTTLTEVERLRAENQQLRRQNYQLMGQKNPTTEWPCSPIMSNEGSVLMSPISSPVVLDDMGSGLLDSPIIETDEDGHDKAFDSQIDKAKLKTKLCKYFMQSHLQEDCPFFGRHGWCAFAHGESELAASHQSMSSPLVQSPTATFNLLLDQRNLQNPTLVNDM